MKKEIRWLKGQVGNWSAWMLAACVPVIAARAQGLPKESRETIHRLFDGHGRIERKVTETADGYVAVTESDDPALAEALRAHVRQMEERLDSGLWVRRHDPAFVEYIGMRDRIRHKVESTPKGLRVTVEGKTPAAAAVARNHARVVSDFAAAGWEAHDRSHPTAKALASVQLGKIPTEGRASAEPAACRMGEGRCCSESGPRRPRGSGSKPTPSVRHHP